MVVAAVLAVVAGHVGDGAASVNNQAELLRWGTKGQGGVKVALAHTGVGMYVVGGVVCGWWWVGESRECGVMYGEM